MLVLCFGLDFKSHRGVGGGGRFYCTTEASSLIREVHPLSNVLFSWDVRGNYSTKSKVAEFVKRLHLGCVFELLGTFEISQNCWGVGWGSGQP